MADLATILDLAFKVFCIIAALVTIGSLIDSYWGAWKAWKELQP